MSMTLKRIELWNIRCHEHFQFSPDETGITSISGSNGAGKSTIVDAFAWGMYGTKTNNIKNKMLIREGIDPKKETVQVEVEININRIEYLVRRTILGEHGGAECNVYGRPEGSGVDFNHLAGPAISSAESYIKQVTRMDEKGFLTAVLIQQKQVDQIVAASPRERGEVIEKLTGIQAITNAISMAREEANTLKKAASVITVEDTATLEETIKNEIKVGKDLAKSVKETELEIKEGQIQLEDEKSNFLIQSAQNEEAKETRQQLALNKERLKMQKEEMSSLMTVIEEYKKETKTVVVEDVKGIEVKLREANRIALERESELSSIKKKIKSHTSEIKSIDKKVTISESEMKKSFKAKSKELKDNISLTSDLNDELQNLKGEEKQVKKSLSTLSDDVTECPVCKSHIDNPEDLREEINLEIEKMKSRAKDIKKEVTANTNKQKDIEDEIQELTELTELITRKSEISKELESLNKDLVTNEDSLDKLNMAANVLDKQYKNALKVASRADEVNRSKLRLGTLNDEMAATNKSIATAENEIESLNALSDRALAGLRNSLDETTRKLNRKEIEFNKNNERLGFLRLRVEDLKVQYNSAVIANTKYEQLTTTMKQANVASSLMSEFKENRIKYSIPALEMYASTILSKFTDGAFVNLSLDSKFNTYVTTDTGSVRPIAQLSGGELSAAAIALRIGISMLLNDGENNVLILDEILVSMDESRARHIIETITSITNCQIIFIAHSADIQTIADKTVLV